MPQFPLSQLVYWKGLREGRLRIYVILAGLYLAQGIPTYLVSAALPPILRENGVSRSAIGFFALLMLPLVLKFAWAWLVDRHGFPGLGHRRSWILPTQLITLACMLALSFSEPGAFTTLFALCFVMSLALSTQDIAADGYAVRALKPDERPLGNAIQGGAVAFGVIIGGTLSLILYEHFGWRGTLLVIGAISALPLLVLPLMKDDVPLVRESAKNASLRHFFRRAEAVQILIIALVYRASEGLVKAMEGAYLVDAGFSLTHIGYLSGGGAATAGLAGSFLAAWLLRRRGTGFTLVLLGSLRTLCFAVLAGHALGLWPHMPVLMGAILGQTLLRYMEVVALYALFMSVADPDQPGTDFTLLACAQLLVYILGASLAGILADRLGYAALFSMAAVLSLLAVLHSRSLLQASPLASPNLPEEPETGKIAP